jgi:hypothetical protein
MPGQANFDTAAIAIIITSRDTISPLPGRHHFGTLKSQPFSFSHSKSKYEDLLKRISTAEQRTLSLEQKFMPGINTRT